MATQYIKYAKKCRKNFFSKIIGGGHGPFWPGGGYAHASFAPSKNPTCHPAPTPNKKVKRLTSQNSLFFLA